MFEAAIVIFYIQDIGMMGNDFHIDKVTECKEASTGKVFDTDILTVTKEDLKAVLKKNGWNFPLEIVLKDGREACL